MLRSYFKLAFRSLRRQPGYTFINVVGLAVGMAVCVLVGLYVNDELSFDRFHEDAEGLVVIGVETDFFGRGEATPYPLAAALEADLPDVRRAVRTTFSNETALTRPGTQHTAERRLLLADAAFFEAFTFPLVAGDAATVLAAPDAVVITESTARLFFGDEDPVGRALQVQNQDSAFVFTVRGVARDVPARSSIQFDAVAPLQILPEGARREDGWGAFMYRTYARLRPGASAAAFERKVNEAMARHFTEDREAPAFFALPMPDYYLSGLRQPEGFKGQRRYLYLFGSVAFFVLLIAAINYVNLATAQATKRAREVGVRKALGAGRLQLVRQFLGESVLLSGAGLLAALGLTELVLPIFNDIFDKQLALDFAAHGGALLGLSAFVLTIGVAAGAYPAFVLARFQPARVLRGAGTATAGGSGGSLRRGLVIVQFALSVLLLVGTFVIYRQLGYMQAKDLGFSDEQVVTIELSDAAWRARETLGAAARAHSGVAAASTAMGAPGSFQIRLSSPIADVSPQARAETESITFAPAVVDHDYVETLGLRVVAGRPFARQYPTDAATAYLINETAAAALGWTPEEAVGKPFKLRESAREGEVVGVVEDFHFESLRRAIEPVALQLYDDPSWRATGLLVARLAPERIPAALAHLEALVKPYSSDAPFTYTFLDETFAETYGMERRLSQVFTIFALLAVLIACLGLFGLASYTAEVRTKEIGIRKVLGATVPGIVGLLSRDFVVLVGVAFALAAPAAYFGMSRWLDDFAYRVDISWEVFALAGLAVLTTALATVSYHAVRAATANPVQSLRYE